FPYHQDLLQAPSSSLRITDDLLPAGHAHARRLARCPDRFHAEGFAHVARFFRRRRAAWNSNPIRGAGKTEWDRGSFLDRRKIYWELGRVPDPGRQHLLRKTRFFPRSARA